MRWGEVFNPYSACTAMGSVNNQYITVILQRDNSKITDNLLLVNGNCADSNAQACYTLDIITKLA